jgi:HSP20 family molecular chaperone IbpA
MILYHHSPFQFYPNTSFSWTPYIITPTASSQRRCGYKKQKICDVEKSSEGDTNIIYQDRNTRIQHIDGSKVEFSLDLPGIKASDTKVEINNGVLKVEAERKLGNDRTTKVERCFSIKDITATESDDIYASLEDGVLRITIPKKVEENNATEEAISSPIPVVVGYPSDTNSSEGDTTIRFSVDLPGVSLSNIDLDVKNDTISLLATRKLFGKDSTTKRRFTIDTDKVDATTFKGYLVDGVLTIIGLKKAVPGPKHIVVTDGSVAVAAAVSIENATESKEEDDMVIVETVTEEEKKN